MNRGISREKIERVIAVFNRYRNPELVATLHAFKGNYLVVFFTGTACSSCGGQDYMEDFSYDASDMLKEQVILEGFEDLEGRGFRARFVIGEGFPRA